MCVGYAVNTSLADSSGGERKAKPMSLDTKQQKSYRVGIMKTLVESKTDRDWNEIISGAVEQIKEKLSDEADLQVQVFDFVGPHLLPSGGTYSPLDFLKIGLSEKLERNLHFLLIVTEVDLASTTLSFTLAYPSQLMNIGVLSTRRLQPTFWGKPADPGLLKHRLAMLLLHTFGHLLNLTHQPDSTNIMYPFAEVQDLDKMSQLTGEQKARMHQSLPVEAHDRTTRRDKLAFTLRETVTNLPSIFRAVFQANPLRLITRLPTMITAAISVLIVTFYTAEAWDVGSTVSVAQLSIFAVVALFFSSAVLYRAFSFGPVENRTRTLAESTVVSEAAILFTLLISMLLMYLAFFLLVYIIAVTLFPAKLMATWPTVDPAVRTIDHIRLGVFISAISLLAGSLGGRADSSTLVRHVLFLNEET